jgi:hypothetical protein
MAANATVVIQEALSDLVVETIIEFYGLLVDECEWWRVACVSRRWRVLAIPVLHRVHCFKWPRFLLTGSSAPSSSGPLFVFSRNCRHVERRTVGTGSYAWAFVCGIPLPRPSPLSPAPSPVCVEFDISKSAGAYVGLLIVWSSAGRACVANCTEWDPSTGPPAHIPEPALSVVMGCHSSSVFIDALPPTPSVITREPHHLMSTAESTGWYTSMARSPSPQRTASTASPCQRGYWIIITTTMMTVAQCFISQLACTNRQSPQ